MADTKTFEQITVNDIWTAKHDYKMAISLSSYAVNDRRRIS